MSGSSQVAHQFEDRHQQQQAATLGIWLFLITEILFFGGLFISYALYRWMYPGAFALASHHLDVTLGAVNTAVLISSSLTMALAVRSAQLGQKKNLMLFLLLTIALGSAFLGVKSVEYAHKFHEYLVPGQHFYFPDYAAAGPEIFFSLYFAMTGLHALHMIIGIIVLIVLSVMAFKNKFNAHYYNPVEVSGLYWHFVDIVWIFLFPLLYLIGRHG